MRLRFRIAGDPLNRPELALTGLALVGPTWRVCYLAFSPQGIGLPAEALGSNLATLRAAQTSGDLSRWRAKHVGPTRIPALPAALRETGNSAVKKHPPPTSPSPERAAGG
jgi:hypothetical protein